MKLRQVTPIVALSLCLAFQAGAQYQNNLPQGAGPYGRLAIGPSFQEDGRLTSYGGLPGTSVEYYAGLAAELAIGYAFNRYVSTEFSFGIVGAEIDSAPGFYSYDTYLDNMPFLVNLMLRYPIPRTLVTPYLGAGVGGTVTVFDTDGFGDGFTTVYGTDSDVAFAWQAFGGVSVELNQNMALGIGYKFFYSEDVSFSFPPYYPYAGPNLDLGFAGARAHTVLFSFQYKF